MVMHDDEGFNGMQWNKTGMLELSEIEPKHSLGTGETLQTL